MFHRSVVGLFACYAISVGRAEFPSPFDTETRGTPPSAAEAAAGFRLPPQFAVNVFAAEPDVRQPIAMSFDSRGRLWVAENYTYAESAVNFATQLNDRVLIFEDSDHDGHFDRRTVFWDQAKILTSVETGNGGVYLLCPPRLLFIPDRNQDDVPDGEPEVLLDGFNLTNGNRHTFANGLKWGPDGWLWGRVGISSGAKIGSPGQPENQRVEMRGGIWRYHPRRHVFEAVSHGTTNPWGLDWNDVGEPFFINTVIGHLWHAIPGAHFQRMHGDDVHPRSYALIDQHADHYHFDTGAGWTKSRATPDGSAFAPTSDRLGGGHAHSGLMIYLGANWPAEYRDHLFTLNFHGRRVNEERLVRSGSGYVGQHEPDFLQIADPWFRGLDLLYGPDGSVFVSDWSDTGECHDQDGVHRNSGRIYRVAYGKPAPVETTDLRAASNEQLAAFVFDRNEWFSRHARRVLADRFSADMDLKSIRAQLHAKSNQPTNAWLCLRALWGLQAIGGNTTEGLLERTYDPDEYVRSWAVRLLVDEWPLDDPAGQATQVAHQTHSANQPDGPRTVTRLVEMARSDSSALVRLYLASALQRLDFAGRLRVAAELVHHGEDVADHNLPLMLWYGIQPLVGAQPENVIDLALSSRIPRVREMIARRLAEAIATHPEPLARLLGELSNADTSQENDVLRGIQAALRGWRKAPQPATWARFAARVNDQSDLANRDRVRELGAVFGDGRALDDLRALLADPNADPGARRKALEVLLENRADGLAALLKQAANDNSLRTPALIGLLQLGDPDASTLAINGYLWVGLEERPGLLGAMVTRRSPARNLLDAIAARKIPKADLTPFLARQIASLNDPLLTQRLEEFGVTSPSLSADKRTIKAQAREQLSPANLKTANRSHGRELFNQVCASCHRLYGEGGDVGPDLTGSGRANLDYLLENIIEPSAVVPPDYRMAIVTLKDGRVLNGVLREATDRTVTVQSQTDRTVIERREIESLEQPNQSMMPDGLLESLTPAQARDLIAYLMYPQQVPLDGKQP